MGLFDTPGTEEGGEPALQKAEEFSVGDKLAMEKEVTGMYLSGHPMMDHAELYETGRYARSDEIFRSSQGDSELYRDGQQVTLLVMIAEMRRKNTKNGGTMAFLTLEDMYGAITGLVFPKTLEGFADLLEGGAVVEVSGRLSFTEDQEPEPSSGAFLRRGMSGPGSGRLSDGDQSAVCVSDLACGSSGRTSDLPHVFFEIWGGLCPVPAKRNRK